MAFTIWGVHPVEAPQPCHLIEAELGDPESFDWAAVTQEEPGQPRSNWQAPWDEQPLDSAETRWAFFFHYLDPSRPLLTPNGPVELPPETPVPDHLANIRYESPC